MNSDPPSSRTPGRPKDEAKRAAIVDAAWEHFITNGVQATSLEAIAKTAGVSRVTVYSHFPDKGALFEETIEREMRRLEQTQQPFAPGESLRQRLIDFGIGLMHFLMGPGPSAFYAVLAGELRRHPELAQRFFNKGPAVTQRNLATLLAGAAEQGLLHLDDPIVAADQLCGLWQGLAHFRLALQIDMPGLEQSIPERVRSGVDIFLTYYGTPRTKTAGS